MLDGVDIRSSKEKILNLQELKFDTKVKKCIQQFFYRFCYLFIHLSDNIFQMEKKCIAVSASLNTFSFLYNHKEIHHWLTTNFGYLSSSNSVNFFNFSIPMP